MDINLYSAMHNDIIYALLYIIDYSEWRALVWYLSTMFAYAGVGHSSLYEDI